jgi:YD repeat-containing protein
MNRIFSASALLLCLVGGPALAAETVTHKYDALGRLKQSTKSGGPANGQQTKTNHDPAGNRTCQSTTGVGGALGTSCPPHDQIVNFSEN